MKRIPYAQLFHQASKDVRDGGAVQIPKDSAHWPDSWKTTYYKTYPELPSISLNRPPCTADLYETIRTRTSNKDFSETALDADTIAQLLLYGCGITHTSVDLVHRAQPSGGARYPIELYALIRGRSGAIGPGLYHYNVHDHALTVLWERTFTNEEVERLAHYRWISRASLILFMTARFKRTHEKYGERSYRYTLLEAGHIGQNICLVGAALDISVCPVGGSNDIEVEKLLDIDGVTESVVYTLAIDPH